MKTNKNKDSIFRLPFFSIRSTVRRLSNALELAE